MYFFPICQKRMLGALLLCPCLFRPSDNVCRSLPTDATRWAHFSTVISPSWITEQISVGKCVHQGASARRERQTSFKILDETNMDKTSQHRMYNTPPDCFSTL